MSIKPKSYLIITIKIERGFMKVLLVGLLLISQVVSAKDIQAPLQGLKDKFKGKKVTIVMDGASTKMIKVDGKEISAPAMKIGRRNINNNFSAVDGVKKEFGGTATIFVRDGEDFVRISTNVLKDGKRACLLYTSPSPRD